MTASLTFLLLLAFLASVTAFAGVKTVPQGYNWTVERFGRFHSLLQPGLNFIVPFIDRIGRKMSVMETVLQIPAQRVITKDNASVEVDGIVFYIVLDTVKAVYAVQHLENAIVNLAMTNIRTAIGSMDLEETLSNRERINASLLHVVDLATESWGTKITRVELKDVVPPADVLTSMAKLLAADREARAVTLEADGVRKAAILKAEGQKQSAVLAAEGQKLSAVLAAEGQKQSMVLAADARLAAAERDAQARERLAAAEAAATRSVSEAVAGGSTAALNYFIAQRYTEALTRIGTATNAKLVLLPLEAASLAGSVAGIAELVKDAFPKPGGPTSAPSPVPPSPWLGGPGTGAPEY